MGFNFNISYGSNLNGNVERDLRGNWFYELKDLFGRNKDKCFNNYKERLHKVLHNPALLKILIFRADIYSQVKFNTYRDDKILLKDFLYSELKRPNLMQSWVDFNWDVSFWRDLGNAYIYKENDVMYCLNPAYMQIKDEDLRNINVYRYSEYKLRQSKKGTFKARLNEYTGWQTFELKNLYILSDLSNTVSGSWLEGNSRLDALYKVISNSEHSLDSKNVNLKFTKKFFVNGQYKMDGTMRPMEKKEQDNIEKGLTNSRTIYSTPSKTDIRQLVDNLANLKLDDSYIADLTIIANMYGVTKDILDIVSKGSTFENKEKSLGSFIDYTLMPKVQQHSDLLELLFEKEDIRGTFKHLPFNAIFEKEKYLNKKIQLENLKLAFDMGMDITNELKILYEDY